MVKPNNIASSGSCHDWIRSAGIADVGTALKLIGSESNCRPDAINPTSGACGIPQALPCSKMQCSLQDPVCQLRWMDGYVKNRYKSWSGAYAHWLARVPINGVDVGHWY